MKQAATKKKITSTEPKTRQKISASVAKNAKMPEKSVSAKKIVSAKSVNPPAKKNAKAEVSKKIAAQDRKAKNINSVKTTTKSVLVKAVEKKAPRALNAKTSNLQKADKTTVSKKTTTEPSAQKPKSVRSKVQAAKSVLPKYAKKKQAEAKAQKTEKSAVKTKAQNAKTVKTANGKILTAKPKAAKIKTIAAEKSISRTGKKIAAKSVSAATSKKSKIVSPASASKIKKTIEKSPVNTAKTKVGVAKKTIETVKPKTAAKPKTIAPKIKNVPKTSAAKAVSKVVTREVKIKTARTSAKLKISAQPERKDILKYAKPAITGNVKSPQRKAASIKIEAAKIEPKILEEIKEPKKKPLRAISSAIFRGEKDRYQFKVYEIGESFKEISAVYVISKRITDRRNRGHHKLICIGQTDSILKDLKTHRKSKCLRVNKANVISILREENEEIRLEIENDLKAAHSIACNLEPGANLK